MASSEGIKLLVCSTCGVAFAPDHLPDWSYTFTTKGPVCPACGAAAVVKEPEKEEEKKDGEKAPETSGTDKKR